jgi:hypothetical protein
MSLGTALETQAGAPYNWAVPLVKIITDLTTAAPITLNVTTWCRDFPTIVC